MRALAQRRRAKSDGSDTYTADYAGAALRLTAGDGDNVRLTYALPLGEMDVAVGFGATADVNGTLSGRCEITLTDRDGPLGALEATPRTWAAAPRLNRHHRRPAQLQG